MKIRVEVTREDIDGATRGCWDDCAISRAMRRGGIDVRKTEIGYVMVGGTEPRHAVWMPEEAQRLAYAFDLYGASAVEPLTFELDTDQPMPFPLVFEKWDCTQMCKALHTHRAGIGIMDADTQHSLNVLLGGMGAAVRAEHDREVLNKVLAIRYQFNGGIFGAAANTQPGVAPIAAKAPDTAVEEKELVAA